MGFAMELMTRHAVLPPEARLLVTTGFLGGLTTFSTLFGRDRHAAHARRIPVGLDRDRERTCVGSLAMTVIGILLIAHVLYRWGTSS